jgi:hypothetical protein
MRCTKHPRFIGQADVEEIKSGVCAVNRKRKIFPVY